MDARLRGRTNSRLLDDPTARAPPNAPATSTTTKRTASASPACASPACASPASPSPASPRPRARRPRTHHRPRRDACSAMSRPRPCRRTRRRGRRRQGGRGRRAARRGRRRGGTGRGRRHRGSPCPTTADISAGGLGSARRADRARVAERGRDVDDVDEDEVVMMRDAGGGAAARDGAGAALVGPAQTRPTSAPAG